MFAMYEVFIVLHLLLAIAAHRVQASRITKHTIFIYSLWLVLIASNILAIFLNGNYVWSENDTRNVVFSIVGVVLVFIVMKVKNVGLTDPMLKSFLAIVFKAMPQVVMVFEVLHRGGQGVPLLAIIAGHVTILTRIGQILFLIREAGWDRNRVWLGISEGVNELSWVAVTIIWISVL